MKGFTLVEMLVVVLILGILVSVSVPQYQKAVQRVKYEKIRSVAEAVLRAEKVYYLSNGQYTAFLEDLDISLPDYISERILFKDEEKTSSDESDDKSYAAYRKRPDYKQLLIVDNDEEAFRIVSADYTLPANYWIWVAKAEGYTIQTCNFPPSYIDAQAAAAGAQFCKLVGAKVPEPLEDDMAWLF